MINPGDLGDINASDWRNYPDHYTNCLWPDSLPSNPQDYGSNEFHGRTHPDIIRVALERYTKPGDLVWDPMAGSGTTIDVCSELNRHCIASDNNPSRDDILPGDARFHKPTDFVDLVVLHPPYIGIIQYGDDVNNLSNMDYLEFMDAMHAVIENVSEALKLNHVLVLIVGSVYGNAVPEYKETIALDIELFEYLDRYRLLGRVFRTYGETKGGATAGAKNENLWKYRRLKNGIWSLGVETVLFLQRVS